MGVVRTPCQLDGRSVLKLHLEYNAEFDLCYSDINLLDFY